MLKKLLLLTTLAFSAPGLGKSTEMQPQKKIPATSEYAHTISAQGVAAWTVVLYVGIFLATLAHEMGHALVSNAFGSPAHAVIGTAWEQNYHALNVGAFSIGGFNPATGFCEHDRMLSPAKEVMIALAGPLAGAGMSMILGKIAQALGGRLSQTVFLFSFLVHLSNLVPNNNPLSDGAWILKSLGVGGGNLERLLSLLGNAFAFLTIYFVTFDALLDALFDESEKQWFRDTLSRRINAAIERISESLPDFPDYTAVPLVM